eukprot:Hpha_TRINITY_DN5338_c0_g1::TRINITY_DN5338_c0_g1_i1::g.32849::m.32849
MWHYGCYNLLLACVVALLLGMVEAQAAFNNNSSGSVVTLTKEPLLQPSFPSTVLLLMIITTIVDCAWLGAVCWVLVWWVNCFTCKPRVRVPSREAGRTPVLNEVKSLVWQRWSWCEGFVPVPKHGKSAPILGSLMVVLGLAAIGCSACAVMLLAPYYDDPYWNDEVPDNFYVVVPWWISSVGCGLFMLLLGAQIATKHVIIFDDNTRTMRAGSGCFNAWWCCPKTCPTCCFCAAREVSYDELQGFIQEEGGCDECCMPIIAVRLEDGRNIPVFLCSEGSEVAEEIVDEMNAFLEARRGGAIAGGDSLNVPFGCSPTPGPPTTNFP